MVIGWTTGFYKNFNRTLDFLLKCPQVKAAMFSNLFVDWLQGGADKFNDIIICIDSYEGDELDIRTLVEAFKIKNISKDIG